MRPKLKLPNERGVFGHLVFGKPQSTWVCRFVGNFGFVGARRGGAGRCRGVVEAPGTEVNYLNQTKI